MEAKAEAEWSVLVVASQAPASLAWERVLTMDSAVRV
jgi:hypothetical protein